MDREQSVPVLMNCANREAVQGLTSTEARRRLKIYGANLLVRPRPAQRLLEIAGLISDPMAVMLAVAGVSYLMMGERLEGFVLLGALLPVLGVDVILEMRSREEPREQDCTKGTSFT